jgi:hypothetical protein
VDAVWPVAALIAASVSAREATNADDQPSRIVSDENRHVLSLPRRRTRENLRAVRCRRADSPFAKGPVRRCRRFYWARKLAGTFWDAPVQAHFQFRSLKCCRDRYRDAGEDAMRNYTFLSKERDLDSWMWERKQTESGLSFRLIFSM